MTVRIDKETRGRFGNKIFHYNTMMQVSNILGKDPSSCSWGGMEYFNDICNYKPQSPGTSYEITCKELNDLSIEDLKEIGKSYDNVSIHDYALHGPFYKISKIDPRTFLTIKPKWKANLNFSHPVVGIHIRGGDIRGADGNNMKEVHSSKFYKDAIDHVLKSNPSSKFFIATDDPDVSYEPYRETRKYLSQEDCLLNLETSHNSKNFIGDFAALSEADILIGGSSTFVMAAAIIGKNKKVIHSYKFFKQFLTSEGDWYSSWGNQNFYKDAINMKSKYYDIEFL